MHRLALYRRVHRLLPAGLATTGLLPPPQPLRWEASPLSCLPLGGGRRGVLGLRLQPDQAAAIRAQGADWLNRCVADAAGPPAGRWQQLPGRPCAFWACRADGGLAWLLDAAAVAAWLFWQEPSDGRRGCCG